ncbi:MAG: FAD-dependent oxidoreductase [Proteobacteria bacterium]|nr:FAD-dependent oxidoreductase [Pseudomonadota bacterium]
MSEQAPSPRHVVVIGAGIVGVCSALALLRAGFRVTLLERDAPGQGASFGNGAVIGEAAVVPVATPGLLRKVPGMLLDPRGPLALRWSYLPRIAPWLLRFAAASRPKRVEQISIALAALLAGSFAAFDRLLAAADAADMLRRTGWLCVYETEAGLEAYRPMLELQRRRGVSFDILNRDALREFEPALGPIFARAVYYPDVGYALDGLRLVQVLAAAFGRHGGTLTRAEARGFEIGPDGPRAVLTEAGPVPCDAVVVAAGAWSKRLAAELGSAPPLDTERGYHVQFAAPGVAPRLPVYSTERGIIASPLEVGLRVGGTVELGGLEAAPNWDRARVLLEQAKRWFPGLRTEGHSRWMGFRPSMPDSLPVIGRAPRFANAIFAFGHGHCGMMMGARTGEIVAALLAERDPGLDMTPYRADRF